MHQEPTRKTTSRTIRGPYPIGYTRHPLTDRQRDIARMLGEGKKQTEIAYQLQVSESCVHNDVKWCLDKLYLYNTKALVDWARMYPDLLLK
jgi:DNA-binding NarL/FixJ family response regulator